jgi:signal transduction histidine kinase
VLKDRAAWLRYGVAVALVLGIGLARFALLPLLGPQAPLLPFVLAIYAAAYLGGLRPALLASGFSAVLATALFTAWPTGPHAQEWTAHDTVTHILGCVTDVTARKQAQDALQAADRRKDQFLSMLAHELRNPLAPIRNVAQILASGRVEADAVRRTGELLMR